MSENNVLNGLFPPNSNMKSQVPLQERPIITQRPFNGMDSLHSSRDSSPGARLNTIPLSQLPPSRDNIPTNQLPPSSRGITSLSHNFEHLNIASPNTTQATPNVSPRPQNFSTSTPILQQQPNIDGQKQSTASKTFTPSNTYSPIVSASEQQPVNNTTGFTHSASSHFTNVPLNTQNEAANDRFAKQTQFSGQPQANSMPLKPVNIAQNTGRVYENKQNDLSRTMPVSQPKVTIGASNITNGAQNLNMPYSSGVPYQNIPLKSFNQPPAGSYGQINNGQNFTPSKMSGSNMPPSVVTSSNSGMLENHKQQPFVQNYNYHQQQQGLNSQPPVQNLPPPPQQVQSSAFKSGVHSNRYPMQATVAAPAPTQQPYQPQQSNLYQNQNVYQPQLTQSYVANQKPNYMQNVNHQSVASAGFNKLWGTENLDLLQVPNILPPTAVQPAKVSLGQDFLDAANCSSDVFRCTMTKIPESNSLLQKSRLPLGVLIHPFKDLDQLSVIQCNAIVRCRSCRTYINPFVFFVDCKRWKCNLCYRVNELPEEFQYDPVSKTYGDPSRRPEIKSSTIEYIAPAEYMLRPPQPAVYLFLLDVSRLAVESGYLQTFCTVLAAQLENLPGDARMQVGFLAYDSALHFFSLGEGLSQPRELTVLDVDDVFLPCPDTLLVNLKDRMELVVDLLNLLPTRYNNTFETHSALGAALQAAHKLMSSTGGRVTVFQATLPSVGPGALSAREDPSKRADSEVQHLNPATDFYKRLALECSSQQIAVDLFVINSQYVDMATLSGISRFSGGCIYHFPLFKAQRVVQNQSLENSFRRYLTRKIGFEAVMRVRCTRGLSIHTFHGNFFVRSTDLLSLPNVNPDAGFGMQIAIEESLSDVQTVCFQAALLYTSSKGERRIRVHTLCLPVASSLSDVINSADQQCIVGLLAKMAVDRSMLSSLSDAREALVNAAIDTLSSYKLSLNLGSGMSGLLAPPCLKLLPLYISALLKFVAFRTGVSTRLDDRVKAMCDMKTKPLYQLIEQIYPSLHPIHNLEDQITILNDMEEPVPQPPHLQLTARSIDSNGAYLMDTGEHMIILVCSGVSANFLNQVLGVSEFTAITEEMYELPVLENPYNQRLHAFIDYLNCEKPYPATLQVIRENSPSRGVFLERLVEDRLERALSYHEFLQHLKTQVK